MEAANIVTDLVDLGIDENDNVIGMVEGAKADDRGVDTLVSGALSEERGDQIGLISSEVKLIDACISGDAHDVLSLLDKGVPANCEDDSCWSPLMHACQNDNFAVVRILGGYDAALNHADGLGITALHLACKHSKNKQLMNYLVRHGADINQANKAKETILHSAARGCNISGMEFSISHGIDVNSRGKDLAGLDICDITPLSLAVQFCDNKEPLDYLLSVGADVNTRDSDGDTLLHVAVWKSKIEGVKFSLEHGLKIGERNHEGENSLNYANTYNASQDIINILQEAYRKELPRCRLCGDEPAHIHFKPCCHQISCIGCSEKWKKCLCSADIEAKIDDIDRPHDDVLIPMIYNGTEKLASELEVKVKQCAKLAEKNVKLAKENATLKSAHRDRICDICLDRNKEVAFISCGHTACFQCSRSLVKCHACRCDIPRKLRLY